MTPLSPPPYTKTSLAREIADLLAEGFGVEDIAVRFRLAPKDMPRLVRDAARCRDGIAQHIAIADRLHREARRQ